MPDALSWEAWITLATIGLSLFALARDIARPHLVLLGSLVPLLILGILTTEEAFAGLSNSAVLVVGSLFVVAAGVQNTGALAFADRLLFPKKPNVSLATLRLMATTATMSAFLNNTPIVAMLIPRVQAWSERTGVPASRLMIPLSYAAIVGGVITLIGTSTNLVVSGLLEDAGYSPLGLFTLTGVGLPVAIAIIAYFSLLGYRFLPARGEAGEALEDDLGECLFEARVAPGSLFVGKTVEEAGLRSLGDAFLVHLRRGDDLRAAGPDTVIREGDRMTFTGNSAAVERLLAQPGLVRAVASVDADAATTLPLYEAVISPSSALVGRTLKEIDFRERYQGVVLAVRRQDAVLKGALGQTPLAAGDLLLIEASAGFDRRWNRRRDEFYLVSQRRGGVARVPSEKAPLAITILIAVVAVAALNLASIVTTAFVGALAMIATGCISSRDAGRSVDLPVLVVIAAALGLGRAIENTGLAEAAASAITGPASAFGPLGMIAAVYVATNLLTEVITNNAAAALMLGVGLAASEMVGAPPEAFAVTVAVAASASFMTPIGYQTNLMVMAPGGYRFADYFRAGFVVNVIVGVVAVTMIAMLWF